MNEWVFKATSARASRDTTLDLAKLHKFLCRSVYAVKKDGSAGARAALVGDVAVGDILHVYFSYGGGRVATLGSFEVQAASRHPGASVEPLPDYGALVALIEAGANAAMLQLLRRGYETDPMLDRYTGWLVERIPGAATPTFDQKKLFPSAQTALWAYPDPALQAKASAS